MKIRSLLWMAWGVSVFAGAADLPVAAVTRSPAAGGYVADASVQAVRQSVVASQVQGRVLELAVKAGDRVRAGQVLARIDDRELGAAEASSQAAIAEAQASLAKAEFDLRRNQSLAKQNFVSPSAVEQTDAQVKALRARVDALRAGASAASVSRSHALVTAPYDGVVAATHVETGDMAAPGKPIATLFQPGALRAVAFLPESQLTAVREGLAKGIAPEIEIGGKLLVGTRTSVLPAADPNTRTTEVRVDLPVDAQGTPGQFARARFALGETQRLAIPQAAVIRRSELNAVYVKTADGRFQQRQVRLGESLGGGRVEVLAGLKQGEQVALEPVKAGIAAAAK
ncbi:efflux RND transporter periplasmic adaptor subunit [Niveibacterium umoris]|uniref:RND family efflux transporter MFP subunit n=1 Tax=Niveibacterium umoris TaxID=1193620 RepID=A0A840BHC1_9RHOO|nr:efflux RND transporter periplasmic adaptor subunit [Niveibacterium umoris]MBB4011058.1 RND family efflux transporter MFP subunit [Niveibacterium umoris]